MKKLLILLLCAPLSLCWAQNTKSGSITGTTCFGVDTTNAGTVGISVQNSSTGAAWSGTIQPSASIGGDPAANITVTPAGSSTAQSTITANGVYYAAISGSTYVQVCGNTVTNTAAIKIFPAQYSKNFGSLAGGSPAFTSLSVVGQNNCGIPPISFAGHPTYGFDLATSTTVMTCANGNANWGVGSAGNFSGDWAPNNFSIGWSSLGNVRDAVADTGLSRSAGNVVAIGNGVGGDETGLLRWNTCKVTADITLPVNTATTVCAFSLPAVAKAWAWMCQIPWVISAGTGTNTLAIIANATQTPTGTTNGSAEIKTTNTNTATEATTAISASGATTLLTSGTITPAATVFMSSTSGTLLASASAGAFAIQMTAAGTTATAAAKAGATCQLY